MILVPGYAVECHAETNFPLFLERQGGLYGYLNPKEKPNQAQKQQRCCGSTIIELPDNVPDRLSAMSNRDWATGAVREHRMRIDAQLLVDRGHDVGR